MRFVAVRSLLAFLGLLLATVALTIGVPSLAGAATASPVNARAAFTYDAPPLFSAPSSAASCVEGAPFGVDLASWGSSAFARDRVVAAKGEGPRLFFSARGKEAATEGAAANSGQTINMTSQEKRWASWTPWPTDDRFHGTDEGRA